MTDILNIDQRSVSGCGTRRDHRLHALDLNEALKRRSGELPLNMQGQSSVAEHWILEHKDLRRMVATVQSDLNAAATFTKQRPYSAIATIERVGFISEPCVNGLAKQALFMFRFFLACTRTSIQCART